MKKIIPLFILIVSTSMLITGCLDSREKAPISTPDIRSAIDAPDSYVILFFYDPAMGTSQEQLSILNNIKHNHTDVVIILPYIVSDPASHKPKEDYRVITTPTTVIIDDKGYIAKRFTKLAYEKMIEEIILQAEGL